MDLLWRTMEASAIAVGVSLFLYVLARLFPYKPSREFTPTVSLSELRKKYTRWELAGALPLFLTTFLGAYVLYLAFTWVSRHLAHESSETRWLMLPDKYFFMLLATSLGLLVGVVATDLLYRFLLGADRYAEFNLYGQLQSGFDARRVRNFLFAIIGIPSILVTFLAIDCYAKFTDDKIIINAFWGVGERDRAYTDIARIDSISRVKVSNDIVERQHYLMHFNDGYVWSSRHFLYQIDGDPKVNSEKEKEVIQFLANKSGKQIETHDLLPEQDN